MMGVGIALGISIGAAIGVSQDNIALWMGVGISLGIALGAAFSHEHKEEDGEEEHPPAD